MEHTLLNESTTSENPKIHLVITSIISLVIMNFLDQKWTIVILFLNIIKYIKISTAECRKKLPSCNSALRKSLFVTILMQEMWKDYSLRCLKNTSLQHPTPISTDLTNLYVFLSNDISQSINQSIAAGDGSCWLVVDQGRLEVFVGVC